MVCVACPVQLVVQPHSEVLIGDYVLNYSPLNLNWSRMWSGLPIVNDRLFGFLRVELRVVCVAPGDKVPHKAPVLLLTITPYASYDGRVTFTLTQ